jgi:hypothetical protein
LPGKLAQGKLPPPWASQLVVAGGTVPEQRMKSIAAWGLVAAFWAGAAAWAKSPPADDEPAPVAYAAATVKAAPSAAPSAPVGRPEPEQKPAELYEPYEPSDGGAGTPDQEARAGMPIGGDFDELGRASDEDEEWFDNPIPGFDPGFYGPGPLDDELPPVVKERHHRYSAFEKCMNFKLMFPELGDYDCESPEQ